MAKDNKFLALLEKYQERFTQKGFLVGDVIKFDKDFKSKDSYKNMGDNVKEVIDSYIDSGLHIRVTQADGGNNIVVAQDHGGGRFVGNVTIPTSLIWTLKFLLKVVMLLTLFTKKTKRLLKNQLKRL